MAAPNTPSSRRASRWPAIVGIGLSAVLLWWTLRDIDVSQTMAHIRGVAILPFVLTAVLATFVFVVRTIQWRYILRFEGKALPYTPLWHATAIGFMATNILPARTGELARALAASRMTSVPFSTAVASIVVARVMDGLTIVLFLAIAVAVGGFSTSPSDSVSLTRAITLTAFAFGTLFVMITMMVHWPRPAIRLTNALANRFLPQRWAQRPAAILAGVLDGMGVLRDWNRFALVAAWSCVVWGVNGLSFLVCAYAFHLDIPWNAPFVLQSLIAFGVAVPSTPGFFGIFEAVSRATLVMFGVPAEAAVSYAIGYHLITFFPITFLGLYSLTRAGLHLTDIRRNNVTATVPTHESTDR